MDLFGIRRRQEERHDRFMKELSNQSDEYLLQAWSALDMDSICETSNKYTLSEFRAVEEELTKRGYANDMGQIIPYKKF